MGERGALDSLSSLSQSSSKKSKKSNKSKASEDTNNFIHFVELGLFKQALSNIEDGNSVLVETFARDDAGKIVFDLDHEFESADGVMIAPPEIHTILLYKIPGTNQVAIVDPSNSTYTRHFVLGHNKVLIENAVSEVGVELIAPSKKVQIYKHPEGVSVGPGADQARDCIDIAVKLAFEIMVHEDAPLLSVDSLKEWAPVVRISNDTDIDGSILTSDCAVRIKQSSDDSIRDKFSIIIEKFSDLIRMVKSSESAKLDGIESTFESRFKELMLSEGKLVSYKELLQVVDGIDNISSVYVDFNNAVRSCLREEEIEILGDGT